MWGRAQSQGAAEFTTGVWRVSKELQQVCLEAAQWRTSQACCASRDGTWQRMPECTLQPLGTRPHRKGKAGSTRKSFCSPHSRGVSQGMAPEKHPLCGGPGQQTPNVLVEWRRVLQEPAQHGRAMAGGSWVSLRSQGSLTPKVLTAGWLRDETFPVHWRTIRSLSRRAGGAAGAPQSCFLPGADSAQSTRSSIVHPVGSGTKKPLCWAELLWVAES